MDRKMLNLGRAKKKLRYFQPEEKAPCSLKIKDVFSLHDLDDIFDDLDSESETPQLSPLPQSNEFLEQAKRELSPVLKPASPFGAEEPEVLAPENYSREDHLNEKGSPFKKSAPIKTSSPIDLTPVGDEAEDAERPETSPILFGVEDEPVEGDLNKPPLNQRSETSKEFHQDESLVSPPVRLEFGKPATEDISVTRPMPVLSPTAANKGCQTSAPETKEESQMDRDSNSSPSVLVQNTPPASHPKEQPKNQLTQVLEAKSDTEIKESSFQQKLRNAFKPKTSLKPETRPQQVRAPSPVELEDDFMILEDDAPILFTIPKKTDTRKALRESKPPPEVVNEKLESNKTASPVESASLKLGEDENKHRDEPDTVKTKKTKAKRGNAHHLTEKDTVAQVTPEERTDPLTEAAEVVDVCEPTPVPEASQEADLPGKQSTKSKTSKSDKLGKKDGKDHRVKRTLEKPVSKNKKPAKVTDDTNDRQEEPAKNVRKKSNKAKSTVKVGGSESEALRSASQFEQSNDSATLTNKQVPEGLEKLSNLHNNTEPPLESTEQPDRQSTTTVKKASKQSSKPGISKRPVKVKKAEKTKENAKIKELPLPESDVSGEGLETSKRKRKPPGEWWLTSDNQNKANTEQPEVAVQQSLQELKFSKKMKRSEAPAKSLQVSSNSTEGQESHSEPNKPVTVQKAAKKDKKSNSTADQENPKTVGRRRKPKTTPPARRKTQAKASAPVFEEEVAADENVRRLSPEACSPPPRRNSLTPGEKRVFEKIYTRDSQHGSAQKFPPESLPGKRQRKPTSTWWEVPHSQGSVESSRSLLNCSPQKTKPQTAPPCGPFDRVTAQKSKINMVHTPKTVKRSLATFNAILTSGKPGSSTVMRLESRQKGRRNLLHSLEDQSEQSSENIPSDQQHGSSHATFDVCTSGVTMEPFAAGKRMSARLSAGSNRASEYDIAFKSGPSSMIELERFEEHEDSDLPSSRMQHIPRVLSDCDFCGPPLQPIVLEAEDWDNLCVWFAHLWPSSSKDGQVFSIISPDDFHWHSYGGRAMGHMVDLQNNAFSNGKILLGSYMKKPPQVDLHAVTVFNVVSSSVRVEIDGVKVVYNSGQAFMTPRGQSYSIHNVCREPAVLWYHRMLQNHTRN
ncbi:uncharacterized protein [Salminus brasiliensis]|uniref:uncharacterized protein n=1 Tax=Salminus brasiliensis TaxID=930266 RepID=UPI003B82CD9E